MLLSATINFYCYYKLIAECFIYLNDFHLEKIHWNEIKIIAVIKSHIVSSFLKLDCFYFFFKIRIFLRIFSIFYTTFSILIILNFSNIFGDILGFIQVLQ